MFGACLLGWSFAANATEWPDLSTAPPPTRDGARDAALLVGIGDYFVLPDVTGADDTVEDWRRYLASRGVPLANIQVLRNAEAAKEAIEAKAAVVRDRVGEGGTLWLVFVGHGAPAADGRDGLLVGSDTQSSAASIYARGVSRSALLTTLSGGRPHETVAVIDACFSGKTGSASSDMLDPTLQPVIPTALASVGAATVLSAGAADQFAGPLPGLGRPAFSYLALGALRGWADSDADGQVTASEVALYAEGALSALVVDRAQTPQVEGSDRVLSRGREPGPDLLALADAVAPRRPGPAVTMVGPDIRPPDPSGLEERIREYECQTAANTEAVRLRDAELTRLATEAETALASEWRTLKARAERAASVEDAAIRADGKAEVSAFVTRTRGQMVSSTAGEKVVSTACGSRGGLAPAATQAVGAAVHAEAATFLARYDANARLPGAATAGSAASGADVTSAVLGVLKAIPAGAFQMGSPTSEAYRDSDETQHAVTLSRGYWMMEREVTQGMWRRVMGSNPSAFTACGDSCPVENVSWDEAVEFARRVSAQEGLTYRLPTEAEWERAARGGQTHVYAGGNELGSVGWTSENSGSTTHPACQKSRNAYGLCDMTGNVWEWVSNWYGGYPPGSVSDPGGPSSGSFRVRRGGSWDYDARYARVANRNDHDPGYGNRALGFRLVRTHP